MEDGMQQNANFITDILDCASNWLENKKGKRKGDNYYLETYLEDVKLLFSADCCVVKAKCYRSMRKTEAPHSLRTVFDSAEVGTEAATQCSCKAGTGKCQHLAALFTHVMAKLRDDDSPTSHLQQRVITETDVKKLGQNISVNSPTTYASWLQ